LDVLHDAPALDVGYGADDGVLSANFNDGDSLTLYGGDWNIVTAGNVTINGITSGGRYGTFTTGHVSKFTGAIDTTIDVATTTGGRIIGGQNIGGKLVINSGGVVVNVVNDVANAVTLTSGNLRMRNATGDGATVVTVTDGNLTIDNITRSNLLANGGVTKIDNITLGNASLRNDAVVNQAGTIGGALDVSDAALYVGGTRADIKGAVTINTTNAGMNKLHSAAGEVTLTAGKLTMHNATGAGALVTVNAGELIMNNAANSLAVNGGTARVNEVVNNVTLANAGNLSVATNIGGTVDGVGTLTLTKAGTVGGATAVTKIVAQADRIFKNAAFTVTELAIEGSSTITLSAANLGATNVTTTETNRLQNIIINGDQNITGKIGTAANALGYVIANTDKGIKIGTSDFHAGIKTIL